MKYMEFYSKCRFELLERGESNWDYYTMQYKDDRPNVVAIAKPGTGADDCQFGTLEYFRRWRAREVRT